MWSKICGGFRFLSESKSLSTFFLQVWVRGDDMGTPVRQQMSWSHRVYPFEQVKYSLGTWRCVHFSSLLDYLFSTGLNKEVGIRNPLQPFDNAAQRKGWQQLVAKGREKDGRNMKGLFLHSPPLQLIPADCQCCLVACAGERWLGHDICTHNAGVWGMQD